MLIDKKFSSGRLRDGSQLITPGAALGHAALLEGTAQTGDGFNANGVFDKAAWQRQAIDGVVTHQVFPSSHLNAFNL